MIVNQIIIQTCQIILLLNLTHTYVLFAANLDDFRSIAKKFIPDKLADKLTDMAVQNSKKYRQQKQVVNKDTYEESEEKEATTPQVQKIQSEQKKRFAIKGQTQQLDFDQLVEKVSQQFVKLFKNKQDEEQENQAHYDKKELIDRPTENSPKLPVTAEANATQDTLIYYEYDPAEPVTSENDGLFQEGDLTKTNDSYEDYEMPEKGNIFESDTETKNTNLIRVPSEIESRYQGQRGDKKSSVNVKANIQVSLAEENDGSVLCGETALFTKKALAQVVPLAEKNDQPSYEYAEEFKERKSEVKGQTGKLFDDVHIKPKKLKGTMIPIRQYFKMSSPNYGNLPAVAEKYDFNEPLPEKDREPEKLKHFPNPPALINKKFEIDKK